MPLRVSFYGVNFGRKQSKCHESHPHCYPPGIRLYHSSHRPVLFMHIPWASNPNMWWCGVEAGKPPAVIRHPRRCQSHCLPHTCHSVATSPPHCCHTSATFLPLPALSAIASLAASNPTNTPERVTCAAVGGLAGYSPANPGPHCLHPSPEHLPLASRASVAPIALAFLSRIV